jgi:hypothetical protein
MHCDIMAPEERGQRREGEIIRGEKERRERE